jgi:hypothetical protein
VLRLLAISLAIITPTAALADPTSAAILASSVFAQGAQKTDETPVKIVLPRADNPPAHRRVAADLREMQAYEYKPAQDYRAAPEGLFVKGKRLAFVRTF